VNDLVRIYVTKDKPSYKLTEEEVREILRSHATMSYEELLEEWVENTKAMTDEPLREFFPVPGYSTSEEDEKNIFEHPFVATKENIKRYSAAIGDNNPLFTDPEYGKKTRYGSQIAPNVIMLCTNYPGLHGFLSPQAGLCYPMGTFISGDAEEFFDVIPVGTRFTVEPYQREYFEKKGSKGRLIFLIAEHFIRNTRGDLLGKQYCTLICLPMAERVTMDKPRTEMVYDREPPKLKKEEIDTILEDIESEQIRGAEPRYWEDVEVGDKLPPFVLPPFTNQDMQLISFAGVNPSSCFDWPYSGGGGEEHRDAILSKYRGMNLPFDFGWQRFQIPARLMYNWMGDDGFLRTMYVALRKVVYWGDVTKYSGEVVKKYKMMEKGTDEPGGVPGEVEYCAVGIKISGKNQLGEDQCPGTARVYLPSRELGSVQLPIPHPPRPKYVPFLEHRRDWY
jgi:hypothetical protein